MCDNSSQVSKVLDHHVKPSENELLNNKALMRPFNKSKNKCSTSLVGLLHHLILMTAFVCHFSTSFLLKKNLEI
ncbi:hypothetical protein H5410_061339 [Solanum commersonii]|uniref:Uncharacterized protein n=1 Tax=Solanum commersonii TaxID=4109 RepID=A0A9J5W7I1_SOLCO|nr:hypothetical protein H5410_061339 [Solanum commersonii]